MRKMIAKIHSNTKEKIVAVCDDLLLGRKIEEGNRQLDLTSPFYKGNEISEETLITEIKSAYIVNAVGEDVVGFLIRENIISEEDVRRIGGVPYVQVVFA